MSYLMYLQIFYSLTSSTCKSKSPYAYTIVSCFPFHSIMFSLYHTFDRHLSTIQTNIRGSRKFVVVSEYFYTVYIQFYLF